MEQDLTLVDASYTINNIASNSRREKPEKNISFQIRVISYAKQQFDEYHDNEKAEFEQRLRKVINVLGMIDSKFTPRTTSGLRDRPTALSIFDVV